MNTKLTNIEAIAFLVILSINTMILSSSQVILNTTASSSLLNILFITFIILIITLIFCLLLKKFQGQDILQISEFLGNKPLKILVGLMFICYFVFRVAIVLKKISDCLQIVYYPMTNVIFIIALFCIAAGLAATLKNNSIFKTSVIVFPLLIIAVILIFLGNSKNYDFENIHPILGYGWKTTFLTGISNIFSFGGFSYLLFLPSKMKNPEKITKISLISMILSAIFLLLSCSSIMLLFGAKFSSTELFPLYAAVRTIEFGTFFQRLDSVFLFLCVLGAICAISLNAYIVIDILKQITNVSSSKPLIFCYILTILGLALCLKLSSTIEFLEETPSKILFTIITIIIPFIILIAANIKSLVNKYVTS